MEKSGETKLAMLRGYVNLNDNEKIVNNILEFYKRHPSILAIKNKVSIQVQPEKIRRLENETFSVILLSKKQLVLALSPKAYENVV